MADLLGTDEFLVNRNDVTYTQQQETLMASLQDTDHLLINRAGQTYKITGSDLINSVVDPLEVTVVLAPTVNYTKVEITAIPVVSGGKQPDGGYVFTYQWMTADDASGTNKTNIAGETGATYTPDNSDVGKYIGCVCSTTDALGTSAEGETFTGPIQVLAEAPIIADVDVTEIYDGIKRYTDKEFPYVTTMAVAGEPAPTYELKAKLSGTTFDFNVISDAITKVEGGGTSACQTSLIENVDTVTAAPNIILTFPDSKGFGCFNTNDVAQLTYSGAPNWHPDAPSACRFADGAKWFDGDPRTSAAVLRDNSHTGSESAGVGAFVGEIPFNSTFAIANDNDGVGVDPQRNNTVTIVHGPEYIRTDVTDQLPATSNSQICPGTIPYTILQGITSPVHAIEVYSASTGANGLTQIVVDGVPLSSMPAGGAFYGVVNYVLITDIDAANNQITVNGGSWSGTDGSFSGTDPRDNQLSTVADYDTTLTLAGNNNFGYLTGEAVMTDGNAVGGSYTQTPYKLTTSQITDVDAGEAPLTDPSRYTGNLQHGGTIQTAEAIREIFDGEVGNRSFAAPDNETFRYTFPSGITWSQSIKIWGGNAGDRGSFTVNDTELLGHIAQNTSDTVANDVTSVLGTSGTLVNWSTTINNTIGPGVAAFELDGKILALSEQQVTLTFADPCPDLQYFKVDDQVQGMSGTAEFTAYHLKRGLQDDNGNSFGNVAELLALTPGSPYGSMSLKTITTTMGDNNYCSGLGSDLVTGFVYHLDQPRAHMKIGLSACSGGSSTDKWRLYMTNDPNQIWGNATMIEKQGLTLDTDPVIDSGDTPYQYFLLFDYQFAPNIVENGIQNYGLNTVLTSTGAKVIAPPDVANRKLTVDGGEWDPAGVTGEDKVTYQTNGGQGNILEANTDDNTLLVINSGGRDNRWIADNSGEGSDVSTDFYVAPANPVPITQDHAWCNLQIINNKAQVISIQKDEPDFLPVSAKDYSIKFPALFPTGNEPDVDLPRGTCVAAIVAAENSEGRSVKESNCFMPVDVNPDGAAGPIVATTPGTLRMANNNNFGLFSPGDDLVMVDENGDVSEYTMQTSQITAIVDEDLEFDQVVIAGRDWTDPVYPNWTPHTDDGSHPRVYAPTISVLRIDGTDVTAANFPGVSLTNIRSDGNTPRSVQQPLSQGLDGNPGLYAQLYNDATDSYSGGTSASGGFAKEALLFTFASTQSATKVELGVSFSYVSIYFKQNGEVIKSFHSNSNGEVLTGVADVTPSSLTLAFADPNPDLKFFRPGDKVQAIYSGTPDWQSTAAGSIVCRSEGGAAWFDGNASTSSAILSGEGVFVGEIPFNSTFGIANENDKGSSPDSLNPVVIVHGPNYTRTDVTDQLPPTINSQICAGTVPVTVLSGITSPVHAIELYSVGTGANGITRIVVDGFALNSMPAGGQFFGKVEYVNVVSTDLANNKMVVTGGNWDTGGGPRNYSSEQYTLNVQTGDWAAVFSNKTVDEGGYIQWGPGNSGTSGSGNATYDANGAVVAHFDPPLNGTFKMKCQWTDENSGTPPGGLLVDADSTSLTPTPIGSFGPAFVEMDFGTVTNLRHVGMIANSVPAGTSIAGFYLNGVKLVNDSVSESKVTYGPVTGTGTFQVADQGSNTMTLQNSNDRWISNDNRLSLDFYTRDNITVLNADNPKHVAMQQAIADAFAAFPQKVNERRTAIASSFYRLMEGETLSAADYTLLEETVLDAVNAQEPFALNGFYPLYYTSAKADAASSAGTHHSHTINGVEYYMPDGGTIYHGNYIS